MPTLSACILARDVADLLPGCLASVRDLAEEIVVVDTGSRDRTPAIAAAAGARVVRVRWPDDEGVARNTAAEACTGDWILVIDPTERLAPGSAEAIRRAMQEDRPAALLHRVEADRAEPDLASVVAGEGRLGAVAAVPRLMRADRATRWEGAALARPRIGLAGAPLLDAWLIGVGDITATPGDADEAWIRRTVLAPEDPRVLAAASRHLRGQGRADLAADLAERAWRAATAGGGRDGLVAAATARALVALDGSDAGAALDTVRRARALGAGHPSLDLLEGLGGLERGTPSSLAAAEAALRRGLSREGTVLLEPPLQGATGDGARIALATVCLATGRPDEAVALLDACAPSQARSLPVRLARAEAALRRGDAYGALEALVTLLEHAGADGWTLAAAAAADVDKAGDALAFVDRAEERADGGFIAPHRRALLREVRARLTARALRARLTGEPEPMDDLVDPVAAAEAAAEAGALDRAHGLLAEALRRDPSDVTAWTDLGVVFHRGGASTAATLALRTAVELAPDDADLREQLAVVLWAEGRLTDAVTQARAALARGPARDAAALLAALDVDGAPRPSVLLACAPARRAALATLVRTGRCRSVDASEELVDALGGGAAGRRAVLAAAAPSLILVDEAAPADWRASARAAGVTLAWVGLGAPDDVDVVLDPADDLIGALGGILEELAPRTPGLAPPLLSVVVPTRDRRDSVVALLDRLALQDLPPGLVEVVIGEDAASAPLTAADLGSRPWPVRRARAARPGPAAARNAALDLARGRFVWFLDDDARPSLDAARTHLVSQLLHPAAHVGDLRLLERHRRTVWDHVLDTTPLHQGRPDLPLGADLSWRSFTVANTSVPLRAVRAVGGFDAASFPMACHEDAELGLRLAEAGVALVHRPDIACGHDHRTGLEAWLERAEAAGRAQVALRRAHPERDDVLTLDAADGRVLDALRTVVELGASRVARAEQALRRLGAMRLPDDPAERAEACRRVRILAETVADARHQRGLLAALSPVGDPVDPRLGATTVVLVHDAHADEADARIAGVLADLRRTTEGPVEVVVVHRGPAGPQLRAQGDIRRVPVADDLGRIEALNAGLALAAGQTVFLCDDDVLFTPGWRPRLLAHLAAWPELGMVAPLGARSREDLDRAAVAFAEDHAGHHAWPVQVPLGRVMIRRACLEDLGGVDASLGALAGMDLALRARARGWRVRLAGDVLVGAIEPSTAPTEAQLASFEARWGASPTDRIALHRASARARVRLPALPRMADVPRLLGQAGERMSTAQGEQSSVSEAPRVLASA